MFKDIFVSYSSKDSEIVGKVVDVFKQNNISYWFAPEQLIGKKHDEAIVPAIKNCKVFLIFLSENSRPRDGFMTSEWVRDELLTAREYKSFIQPIKLDKTVDYETNNLMFKGLPNYFDISYGELDNNLNILKDLVYNLLENDNYKEKEIATLNFFETKSIKILKEIETNLQSGYFDIAENILHNNEIIYDYNKDYATLLSIIIKMSTNHLKDMSSNEISEVIRQLNSIKESEYKNIVYYLEAMISKSYFEFNAIRDNMTQGYNELKSLSKTEKRIKSKFYLMTRHIKNIIPAKDFELAWL